MNDKEKLYWLLHWPSRELSSEELSLYPDLQEINRQINNISDIIEINGYIARLENNEFDVRDFPMKDRVAQREFVIVSGITSSLAGDVKTGKKNHEVFRGSEILVVGIQKRLKELLDEDHNPYLNRDYRIIKDGDVVIVKSKEVKVVKHHGAHVMKYYIDEGYKPILPSQVEYQMQLF